MENGTGIKAYGLRLHSNSCVHRPSGILIQNMLLLGNKTTIIQIIKKILHHMSELLYLATLSLVSLPSIMLFVLCIEFLLIYSISNQSLDSLDVFLESSCLQYIGSRQHSLSTHKPTHADKNICKHQHLYMHMHCKLPMLQTCQQGKWKLLDNVQYKEQQVQIEKVKEREGKQRSHSSTGRLDTQ